MTSQSKHFDGWGNPILDFYSMRAYYLRNSTGWAVVTTSLPYQYATIPSVTIRFWKSDPACVTVFLVYPAGQREFTRQLSKRAVEALRRTYKRKKGWLGKLHPDGTVTLTRMGCAVRLRSPQVGYIA